MLVNQAQGRECDQACREHEIEGRGDVLAGGERRGVTAPEMLFESGSVERNGRGCIQRRLVGGDYTNGSESGIVDRGSKRLIDGVFHRKCT